MKKIFLVIFILKITFLFCQNISSRWDYYTSEKNAELLIYNVQSESLSLEIFYQTEKIIEDWKLTSDSMNIVPFSLHGFGIGRNEILCNLYENENTLFSKKIEILILKPKQNAVQIDRLNGGLFVQGLPFFPFGFYCYSPVNPLLLEEEAVKGFNLVSPYQKIYEDRLNDRIEYMNRCAELGLKVNYNLCSVAGGGGVGSGLLSIPEEKRIKLLENEVKRFKDHPALLSWYISDEPGLNKFPAEKLENIYQIIKNLDPYHPISIVFNLPDQAKKYAEAFDILMADVYPIPFQNIEKVEKVTKELFADFKHQKPIWLVPQAFGGNEWWQREPTKQELRAMTYLALAKGATGIQYFVRHGRNGFPKSTTTWAECGNISLEVAEFVPNILQGKKIDDFSSATKGLTLSAWEFQAQLLLLIVNKNEQPQEFTIESNQELFAEEIFVSLENRKLKLQKNKFLDIIPAFGTNFYQIEKQDSSKTDFKENNLLLDPSFENSMMPGVPNHCYANVGQDRGATYFVDSRLAKSGNHSLRITTPKYGKGVLLKFFKVPLKKNVSYTISVWAKAAPQFKLMEKKRSFWYRLFHSRKKEPEDLTFKLQLNDHKKIFTLSENWEKYQFDMMPNEYIRNGFLKLELLGKTTAWFDELQIIPDLSLSYKIDSGKMKIELNSFHPDSKIFFSLDGNTPDLSATEYHEPFFLATSADLQAIVFKKNDVIGKLQRRFNLHQAFGKKVEYITKYRQYDGGGDFALVDAIYGTSNFKDKKWQGFIYNDCELIIDLNEAKEIKNIKLGFLQDISSWIFLPKKIEIGFSPTKNKPDKFYILENNIPSNKMGKFVKRFKCDFDSIEAQFIFIKADNIGYCPDWHKGAGKPAWLFIDEIEVH